MKKQLVKNPITDKLTKKFSNRGFNANTNKLSGVLSIKKVRSYDTGISFCPLVFDVDIIFKGKIYAFHNGKAEWLDSTIASLPSISKIKLNKFIKKQITDTVIDTLHLFGISQLPNSVDFKISKVTWI